MYLQIRGNLIRQAKGLELLHNLLLEEYEDLLKRDTDAVSILEFSLHELLRQLAVERDEIRAVMQGTRVAEYATLLPEDEGKVLLELLQQVDRAEQTCARQAERNTGLSLALLDQSHELLATLHDKVLPKPQLAYGAKGSFTKVRLGAALVSGRL